ncbi:MAG: hypothetical protein SGARI_001888 [Bacillariaceae sp.]
MLDQSLVRRKQVMAFCIPRIVEYVRRVKALKGYVPKVFVELLDEVNVQTEVPHAVNEVDEIVPEEENLKDRCLWAKLEIVRYVSFLKVETAALKPVIAKTISNEIFHSALIHASTSIRLAAVKAMELVVMSQEGYTDICDEALRWKLALPFSVKANESREYRTYLLQSLFLFLDRLCIWDAGRSKAGVETGLPVFKSFVIDFLLNDIFLQKGGYPGVVADKETFCTALLDCILTFSLQDQRFGDSNIFARNSAIFIRKRSKEESAAMDDLLRAVVKEDIFSSLLALLHSVWDPTRAAAFDCLKY